MVWYVNVHVNNIRQKKKDEKKKKPQFIAINIWI